MNTNGETPQRPEDFTDARRQEFLQELAAQGVEADNRDTDDINNLEPNQGDSIEQLQAKQQQLIELQKNLQETLREIGNPEASRQDLLQAAERYAKQLGIWDSRVGEVPSLSIMSEMDVLIDRYMQDIASALEHK